MKIRQHLSNVLHDLSVRLVPLEPPRYGVRIVHDEDYQQDPLDANADAEEQGWWADEAAKLESGEYVALGMIVVRKCPCCGDVDEAPMSTALWGIVIEATADLRIGAAVFDLDKLTDPHLRETAGWLIAEEQGKADGSIR